MVLMMEMMVEALMVPIMKILAIKQSTKQITMETTITDTVNPEMVTVATTAVAQMAKDTILAATTVEAQGITMAHVVKNTNIVTTIAINKPMSHQNKEMATITRMEITRKNILFVQLLIK